MEYKEDLRLKLPELKNIEGFPKGNDEEIVNLSEPPYFTACPNPYINEFVQKVGTKYDESTDKYHREPFIGDISEGKNGAVYNAHSYHTKIPYKAINQFIEHYTEENDVVLDGFSGTGSTGFSAAHLNRHCILNDLGTASCIITYGYNKPSPNLTELNNEFNRILKKVKSEVEWMFTTEFKGRKGIVQNTILSDVFLCPYCEDEYVFADNAVDFNKKSISSNYQCKNCKAEISKGSSSLSFEKKYDETINKEISRAKKSVVVIQGKIGKSRFEKYADEADLALLDKIENTPIPYWFPTDRMPEGDESRRNDSAGYTHVHHFYTKRNLHALAVLFHEISSSQFKNDLLFVFQSCIQRATITNRFRFGGTGGLSGTLYIPSLIIERSVIPLFENKFRDYVKMNHEKSWKSDRVIVTNQSTTDLKNISKDSVDYIFTDPPFGSNLMYSELSFWWEAWLKTITNTDKEGIINKTQQKDLISYNELMLSSFKEYYRVLKPKRWITIVFHNSKSSVWNGIQEAITKAGFMISQVSTLDKKQGSFKQVTAPGSVANDLVISAFKPSKSFSDSFISQAGEGLEVTFLNEFLSNLPSKPIIERTEKMLYSKMVAYYIQRGYEIRYDAKSFYSLLQSNFIEEDGFWFTSDQINSYIEYKKYAKLNEIEEIKSGGLFLFVTDEKSALVWLHNFLNQPKSFSDVSVAFNQLANIQDDQVPELRNLLEENFVFEGGLYRRPKSEEEHNQITEKRQKQLLKQFESILIQAQTERKKIKEVRKEALTYGFERCYKDKRFKDILTIASKLHPSILENNGELADFVEAAEIQTEGLA